MSTDRICEKCGNRDAILAPHTGKIFCDCCKTFLLVGPHECRSHTPAGTNKPKEPRSKQEILKEANYLLDINESARGGPYGGYAAERFIFVMRELVTLMEGEPS